MYKFKILLVMMIFYAQNFKAQINDSIINSLNKETKEINFLEISDIEILDNRFDSMFFIEQTGLYPVKSINFHPSLSKVLQNNLYKKVSKGNHPKLIINIDQFRICNKPIITVKRKSNYSPYYLRGYIFTKMEFFLSNPDDKYCRLATFKKAYKTYGQINETVKTIFNDIAEILSNVRNNIVSKEYLSNRLKKYLTDSNLIIYDSSINNTLSFGEFNIDVTNKWSSYPINKNNPSINGDFLTFQDFITGTVSSTNQKLVLNNSDSTFFYPHPKYKVLPYAVYQNDTFFIKLYSNKYLFTKKNNGSFYFNVPMSVPNMYTIISIEEGFGGDYVDSQLGNGNISKNFERIISVEKSVDKKKKSKSSFDQELNSKFRNCFIDMDTGDFIY